jgi:hypothetical protein
MAAVTFRKVLEFLWDFGRRAADDPSRGGKHNKRRRLKEHRPR